MMPRPMVLVFMLLILIITSQFEWKQQLVADVDSNAGMLQKQHQISRREATVKEKEQNIQRLNKRVRQLREQLLQCRNNNKTSNGSRSSLAERIVELEREQIQED